MFNTIYTSKESVAVNANTPLILELFYNGKDEFGGHWDHKYWVVGLWVWAPKHYVLCSNCFSVNLVNNTHGSI